MTQTRFFVPFVRIAYCLLIAGAATHVHAQNRPQERYKFNPPPSAELTYKIKAQQSGMNIGGDAKIKWQLGSGRYSVVTETRAMLVGKILEEKSEGLTDSFGLAPLQFTQTRFRKEPVTATFNREAKTISFGKSDKTYAIKGGEQDRVSILWQLISVARAAPARFKPGSTWSFFVAGQADAEPMSFSVGKQEKIRTALGDLNVLQVSRNSPAGSKEQQLTFWLAPSKEWYPVRLRISDGDEYIEQTIESITKK